MSQRRRKLLTGLIPFAAFAGVAACGENGGDGALAIPPAEERTQLGLMTSLPLYWPLGADMAALIDGDSEPPWQRGLLEARYDLQLLDTLSAPEGADDPLGELSQLAVIQPRGLSPQDNVALDDWVRDGGKLLIALDPALTGEYDLALGDPRLPTMAALIPPVIERWGLAVSYDDRQELAVREAEIGEAVLPTVLAGVLALTGEAGSGCEIVAEGAAAKCSVGEGTVTVLADAALFEHRELAGEQGESLASLFEYAFGEHDQR